MEIVNFSRYYIEEIVNLFYNTVHTINAQDYSKAQLNAWAPLDKKKERLRNWEISLERNITLLALVDHKIVGFADLEFDGQLNRLFVHSEFQRQGIATILLKSIEIEARQLKLHCIYTHASITAMPFFKQKGYHVIRRQTVNRSGVRLINYLMRKQLN